MAGAISKLRTRQPRLPRALPLPARRRAIAPPRARKSTPAIELDLARLRAPPALRPHSQRRCPLLPHCSSSPLVSRFVAVLCWFWGGLPERLPFTSSLHPPDLSGRATLTISGHDFAPRHAAAHALTGPPLFARSRRSIPYPILPTPPPSFPACPSIDLLGALWRRICPTLLSTRHVGF